MIRHRPQDASSRDKLTVVGTNDDWDAMEPRLTPVERHFDRLFGKLGRSIVTHRVWLLGIGHALVFILSFWLAFCLRFDFAVPADIYLRFQAALPAVLVVKIVIFYCLGHFHGWWRYVTFADLRSLLRASLLSLLVVVLVSHFLLPQTVPRSVVITDCLFTALFLGSLRASFRLFRESTFLRTDMREAALMVGADHSSAVLAHQIHSSPDLPYRIIGFIDNHSRRVGAHFGDIPVLGTPNELTEVAARHDVEVVLVIAGAIVGKRFRALMEQCEANDIEVKVIPSIGEVFSGKGVLPIRDIEINDLLRREPVELDSASISNQVTGKTVMVTGAGGSIGSEICRQLLSFRPRDLILVDCGENSLFLLNTELEQIAGSTRLHVCVADVRDANRMKTLFQEHRPMLVLHAAAQKHVGVVEDNAGEAIKTNVFGTKCVADLAAEFETDKFVLVSTDKAVNPTSVMGATKQLAERYVHALAQESSTAFLVVRFGNVLASNGSVVPLFQDQIRRGGPITITDPRMTRFFMTIPEASQLVLQASSMGRGGEVFVLEMGEQIRVLDLAQDLVRLSGLPSDAIEIVYIGARPGEKLFEELYFDEEESLETSHPKLRAAYHRPCSVHEIRQAIDQLVPVVNQSNQQIRAKLTEIVPEYLYTPAKPSISTAGVQATAKRVVAE